jgi:DNA-binding transcriptional LysR family regulator
MTLEQLRIFVAVAERQHMTQAAEALALTQSTVSAAVAKLEARYQTRLFNRVGRGVELTDAGRLFLAEARAVLGRAEEAETALAEIAGLRRGRISVAASQTVASYWLPERLVRFRAAHPAIDVRLQIGNTTQVAAQVLAGEAELGFVEAPVDEPELRAEIVGEDHLAVVVAASHPWAKRAKIGFADLVKVDWVLRERGSGTRSEFEAALRGNGVDPASLNVVLELPGNEAVRAAVLAGGGATAISEMAISRSLHFGDLKRLKIPLPTRPFRAIRHRERQPGRAAETLMAEIRQEAQATPARKG